MSLSSPLKFLAVTACAAAASICGAQAAPVACDDPQMAARETIAELREIQGNILVSDALGMASGTDNQRLKNRTRITATSRAGATVVFDCGCVVRLKENERLDVVAPSACSALLAAVQAVPTGAPIGAVASSGGAAGAGAGTGAIVAGGVGVGAYLLYRNNRNVSPN